MLVALWFGGNVCFALSEVKPGPLTSLAIGKHCHSLFLIEKLRSTLREKNKQTNRTKQKTLC